MDTRRFHNLLATTSVTALLVGAAGPAGAVCTINDVGQSLSSVTNSAAINCINIQTSTATGSIINTPTGTITTTTATGIAINGSTIAGAVVNQGSINVTGSNKQGIHVFNSTVAGGVSNAGSILGARTGIDVSADLTFGGGVTNTGTITAGVGIGLGGIGTDSIFSGGVTNSGAITATTGGSRIGIGVANVSTFSGGVTNSGTITASAFGILASGITTFTGGITNSGTITGALAAVPGSIGAIDSGSPFAGNAVGGSGAGISVTDISSFVGGVTNSGTISGIFGAEVLGVSPANGASASGGIVNAPASGSGVGILVANVSTFSGGINNSGTITEGALGIDVATASTFTGGITNTGTVIGTSVAGILVGANIALNVVTVDSLGAASGRSATGNPSVATELGGISTFSGGITNTGTVASGSVGIGVGDILSFSGGITNTGTVSASQIGIGLAAISNFTGGISNSGTVLGTSLAGIVIGVNVVTEPAGFATNLIIPTTAGGGVSTFAGGVINTGTISGKIGIAVAKTPSVSIFDSGVITGTGGTAIQYASGTNTLTLGPGFTVNGNVLGVGSDIFQLGGTGTGAFNLGTIGTQFTGFSTFNVISATWVATGSNSNNWTISGGATLQLGSGGTSGSIAGTIADNGTLAIDHSDTYTIAANQLSGTGSLVQLGPGTTVLNGAEGYSGGTTITAGILRVTSNGSVGGGPVTLNGGAFQAGAAGLVFSNPFAIATPVGTIDTQTNTLTLSGTIANGTGTPSALTKIGSGTLVLTGNDTYTGGTTIAAGTLQLGSGGTSGSIAGNVVDNGVFAVNRSDSLTLGGMISGTGSLLQMGAGTLTLTGANSYSGGTTISAGTLVGNTTSLQGNILDNAALVFNQTGAGSYGGALTGTGTMTIQGAGSVALTGNDAAFAGSTLVAGGNLIVGPASTPNVTLGGPVTVQNGGTLSGHGTILGAVNNPSGNVMPGGSIGNLTVSGNYVQGSSGTLITQLSTAAASELVVSGSASLAGTLAVQATAGNFALFTRYPVLTAGAGVSGTFAQLTETLPGLPITVQYFPNEVDLVVGGFVGKTRDEIAVANALNTAFNTATGDFATVLTAAAAVPAARIPALLQVFGGQIYADLAEVSLDDRRLFLGAMDERIQLLSGDGSPGATVLGGLVPGGWGSSANGLQMAALGNAIADDRQVADASAAPAASSGSALPTNVWARGYGEFGGVDNNGGALGFNYSTGGGAIGADVYRTSQTLIGIAASAGQSSVSVRPEKADITFVEFGVYGAQALDYGALADGAFIYSHDIYDVNRPLSFPGIMRVATSSHGGDDAVVDVGLSRPIQYGAWRITPRAGLSYFHIGQVGFSEINANSLDLAVSPTALDALRTRLGVTVSQPIMLGGLPITPELRAAWTHDYLDDRGAFAATFAGAPNVPFTQIGAAIGRDAADLGAGISFAISQTRIPGQLSAFVQYDATLSDHKTINAFSGGLKLTW